MNQPKRRGVTPDYVSVVRPTRCVLRAVTMDKVCRVARDERRAAVLARGMGEHRLSQQAIQRAFAVLYAARHSQFLAKQAGHRLP